MNKLQKLKAIERTNKWVMDNKEKALAYRKSYYQKNKLKILSKSKAYFKKNPAKLKQSVYNFCEDNPWYRSWSSAKQRCNNPNDSSYRYYGAKGIKFSLSIVDVKYLWERDNAISMACPSIDRLDTSKDYTMDNCQFIEARINRLKGLIVALSNRGVTQFKNKEINVLLSS